MTSFKNKVTLITGGACGLGRLVAQKIAARGSHVVLWDISDETLARTAAEISGAGYKATTYHCDVSDRDMVYGLAEKVKKEVGKVDILINNAGVVSGRPFLECTDEQLERTLRVNVLWFRQIADILSLSLPREVLWVARGWLITLPASLLLLASMKPCELS